MQKLIKPPMTPKTSSEYLIINECWNRDCALVTQNHTAVKAKIGISEGENLKSIVQKRTRHLEIRKPEYIARLCRQIYNISVTKKNRNHQLDLNKLLSKQFDNIQRQITKTDSRKVKAKLCIRSLHISGLVLFNLHTQSFKQ